MNIELFGRGDRLGANITTFIAQIIYAVHNKLYIYYDKAYIRSGDDVRFAPYNQEYNSSLFMESLFAFIDEHNKTLPYKEEERIKMYTIDFFKLISSVTQDIKMDHFRYFKTHIFPTISEQFKAFAKSKNYTDYLNFHPNKTILVHLRLDDVKHSSDYDGSLCGNHFQEVINKDLIADNEVHASIRRIHDCNRQSTLHNTKLINVIQLAKTKYPDYEVVIVTNPGENTSHLPYRCIQSDDPSLDLFLLCNAEVLILSRSTFALSALYFGIVKDAYIPLWGHLPCFGLYTKYDSTTYTYFP